MSAGNYPYGLDKKDIAAVGGIALTGRDISLDLAKLDVDLSTRATETTLALIKAKTDNIPTDPAKESGKLTDLANRLALLEFEDRLVSGDLTADGVQYSPEAALGATATEVLSKIVEPGITGNILRLELGLTAELRADISGVSAWVASTAYSLGGIVKPTGGYAGCVYECTTAGTSGTAEPTWPTADGGTVADNTVTWTCRRFWIKWQWQARNKGGTFVNLHPEVTEDIPSETYFARTRQGFASLVANFNAVPYEVKLVAYRRDVAGTSAKARVKSSSYARAVFQAS